MSNKMWEALIEHAKTCVLSGKLYVYYPEDTRNVGVVFNNIYELSGLIANDQYQSADSLSDGQKVFVTFSIVLLYLFIFLELVDLKDAVHLFSHDRFLYFSLIALIPLLV